MPTLDQIVEEHVYVISLDADIEDDGQVTLRKSLKKFAIEYTKSIVPEMLTDDKIDWRIDRAELIGAGFDMCRNQILRRIESDEGV